MPLEDALSFTARNFDAYLRSLREPAPYRPPPGAPGGGYGPPNPGYPVPGDRRPPPHHGPVPTPAYPPAPVAATTRPPSEKQMSTDEIEAMIEKLKREKEQREATTTSKPTDHERYAELTNQIRESTDTVASSAGSYGGAGYDKYAPPAGAPTNGTNATGYYQQQPPPASYR